MKRLEVILTLMVIGLLLITSLVYRAPSTMPVLVRASAPCHENFTFIRAVARHASPDRYIILALVDAAFVDMAINLYETSLRPNGIDNFLFVGVGRQACDLLNSSAFASRLPCYHYVNDNASDHASVYSSQDFIRKMNFRTDMIIEALNAGFFVVHTDLDVVFFRNPLPHLKVFWRCSHRAQRNETETKQF